jgi:hypothetical protein
VVLWCDSRRYGAREGPGMSARLIPTLRSFPYWCGAGGVSPARLNEHDRLWSWGTAPAGILLPAEPRRHGVLAGVDSLHKPKHQSRSWGPTSRRRERTFRQHKCWIRVPGLVAATVKQDQHSKSPQYTCPPSPLTAGHPTEPMSRSTDMSDDQEMPRSERGTGQQEGKTEEKVQSRLP